jgi:hypothetical protein
MLWGSVRLELFALSRLERPAGHALVAFDAQPQVLKALEVVIVAARGVAGHELIELVKGDAHAAVAQRLRKELVALEGREVLQRAPVGNPRHGRVLLEVLSVNGDLEKTTSAITSSSAKERATYKDAFVGERKVRVERDDLNGAALLSTQVGSYTHARNGQR